MQNLQDNIWIPISNAEDVAVVLHTAMLAGSWSPGAANPAQKLLTGRHQIKMTEGDHIFNYAFDIKLRWAPQQKQEFSLQQITDSFKAGTNPRPKQSFENSLIEFSPQHQGHIIFVDIDETLSQRSAHVVSERMDHFKSILIQEALIFLATGRPKPDPEIYPDASFSRIDDWRNNGYLGPYDDHRRFIVSQIGDEFLSIPPRESNRHVLVSGPTGTGKSRSVFTPNIIERTNVSMIVTEATAGDEEPHLYHATSGWRSAKGHQILYFNPDDLCSDQLNPLDMIKTDRDARMVCELIMKTTTQKSHRGDQFWDTSERMLLTALLLHVCGLREQGYANMGHVVTLVNRSEEDLKKIADNTPVQQAYDRFQAFFARGTDNTRSIVLSCIGQRLDLWNDERTRALTSKTSFDISTLKDQLFTFYLVLSAEKDEFKPLTILIWHYILHIVTNNRFRYPIGLILDEFANLGYVRGMKAKLSLFRHLDIGVALGVQDNSQVIDVYEKESDLFFSQPATKLYFTPNEFKVAKPLSDMLGVTTVVDSEVQGGSVRYPKIQRPLLSPEQILHPKVKDQLLVFMASCRPAHIRHIGHNAYDDFEANYPVPPRTQLDLDEGLKFRYPEDKPKAAASKPWDPQDPKTAEQEKRKRDQAQLTIDATQETQFKQEEIARAKTEVVEQEQEVDQLKYYNAMRAHLAREITGRDMAQELLKRFEADHLALLAAHKGKELSADEREADEIASLKVRIMRDVINDLAMDRVPKKPDGDYPLPWLK